MHFVTNQDPKHIGDTPQQTLPTLAHELGEGGQTNVRVTEVLIGLAQLDLTLAAVRKSRHRFGANERLPELAQPIYLAGDNQGLLADLRYQLGREHGLA